MNLKKKSIIRRNNIKIKGEGSQPIVFAHGFGCAQDMWRYIVPDFEKDYKVILFDNVGAGDSDLSSYSRQKYNSLQGYADDILEICEELSLWNVILVGHSVSAMIAVLAANTEPGRFEHLILLCPSPRYLKDIGYESVFNKEDIEDLLEIVESNFLGWSSKIALSIMGNPDRPELGEELKTSFCSTDPEIAKHFAEVTFLSDNRKDLELVKVPTLILQTNMDFLAPITVGIFVHEAIKNSTFRLLHATGHCPNLSAPEETILTIKEYLSKSVA